MRNPLQGADACLNEDAWSGLPDDLALTILSRLPTPSLLRARAVCRKWNELIISPAILRLCSALPPRSPVYLGFQGFRHERGWAYEPGSNRWYNISFSFLPGLGRCAAAAGGLVCFCQDSVGGNSLYVCNPVTRRWRTLPEFPGRIKHVFMSCGGAGSYSVVAVAAAEEFGGKGGVSLLIFDSSGKSWRQASPPAPHHHHRQLNFVDAALCGGVLYFLNSCLNGEWQFIQTYELRTDMWSDLRVPMPGSFRRSGIMQSAYLVRDEDRLLLVEKVISYDAARSGGGASVGIYELDLESREWRSVEGSLGEVTLFAGSFTSRAIRAGRGDGGGRLVYFSSNGSAVNVYDVERGSWHRLPEFPREKMITSLIVRKPRDKLGIVIPFKGLWFEPRLDASV